MAHGLLISQIGYDVFGPMRALYRADTEAFLDSGAYFEVTEPTGGECVKKAAVQY